MGAGPAGGGGGAGGGRAGGGRAGQKRARRVDGPLPGALPSGTCDALY
jgi:hypothetical protein